MINSFKRIYDTWRAKRILRNAFWRLTAEHKRLRRTPLTVERHNQQIDLFNARCVIFDAELRVYGLPPEPETTEWERGL